jgi:serine/threonine-protein kinase
MDEPNGTPFGRYRLVQLLGRGGMGEVWRAYDSVTERIVAIKVLPANLSDDEDFQRRFRREAHAAARLDTPHVVPIYDYGEIDGRLFVSMRLIKGRDLATVLDDGPLDPARAVRIVDQVAEALHAAHEIGLVHRDIKPANILLDDRDFAYLIDFGIARALDETRMTKSGNAIGTFAYIAPERLDPHAAEDARADIYSLACVLYEALTGKPPFAGSTTAHLIAAHLNTPPPRPSTTQPDVPPQVDEVIAKGMAKDPDNRYATTVELADAARDAITVPIARPAPTPAKPPTELAPSPSLLPPTEQAYNRATAQPMTVRAESPAPAKPVPPPQPAPPIPARAGGISRRTKIALIVGAIAFVAVIAAAVGIPAIVGQRPSESSQTPPSSQTPSERTYAAQVVLPFTGLDLPQGVAVDSAGTLYVTDLGNNRVLKLPAGSATPTVLPFTGLNKPAGVAVDSGGTLYVGDDEHGRVLKLAAGSATPTVLPFTGLSAPDGVAVDLAGTLYVTAHFLGVLKLAAGSATQDVLPFTGLDLPLGVAVDSAGTLYVTDSSLNNRVLKLPAGSATQEVLPFTGLNRPAGVAVDAAGTLYVTDNGNARVLKLPAGSATPTVLPFTDLTSPAGVTVDAAGNLYVIDSRVAAGRVLKLPVQ